MKKLSIGLDSTLENWIMLCSVTFGEDTMPVRFLKDKANKSPNGLKEEVLVDEAQFLNALGLMFTAEMERKKYEKRSR